MKVQEGFIHYMNVQLSRQMVAEVKLAEQSKEYQELTNALIVEGSKKCIDMFPIERDFNHWYSKLHPIIQSLGYKIEATNSREYRNQTVYVRPDRDFLRDVILYHQLKEIE